MVNENFLYLLESGLSKQYDWEQLTCTKTICFPESLQHMHFSKHCKVILWYDKYVDNETL